MDTTLNLEAYFDRIRWGGATEPTFETLAGILEAHMARIPFENLDVLLGRRVRLDLDGLQSKLVTARRGGYCFEHTTLLAAVLERLGFHPARHSARVILLSPRSAAPRTHMFLTVPLKEGTYVLDAGFGALAPRVPVPLKDSEPARAGREVHWMVQDGKHWVLRAQSADRVVDAWVSTLEEDPLIDFEVANHYVSTHPSSPFVNRLMLRALALDGRVSLMNRDMTVLRGDQSLAMQVTDRKALRRLLIEQFGFDLPETERLRVPSIPEWD